jgi:hypothetical protein
MIEWLFSGDPLRSCLGVTFDIIGAIAVLSRRTGEEKPHVAAGNRGLSYTKPCISEDLHMKRNRTAEFILGRGRTFHRGRASLVLAALLATAGSVAAHHGAANYENNKTINLKATITEYRFINPHVLFFFEVKGESDVAEEWQGEASNPLQLARQGWSSKTFKPGDQVTFTGHPTKSGARSLWITSMVMPNGEAFDHLHNEYQP